jgi:hypothetical protein
MNPDTPIYLFLIAVWLFTASLLVLAFVLLTKGPALLEGLIVWARRTFTRAGDDYPQTPETIARAQAVQRLERQRAGIDDDGHPRRLRGLVEIHRASLESVAHVDEAGRRRQLLALVESSPRRKTVH